MVQVPDLVSARAIELAKIRERAVGYPESKLSAARSKCSMTKSVT